MNPSVEIALCLAAAFTLLAAALVPFTRTSRFLYVTTFVLAIAACLLAPFPAHADTVAHASGMENRMLVLTDDKCQGNRGQVALVLSFYRKPNADAPGAIVADGCWLRQSDITLTITWNPDGYGMMYRADQFHWKGRQ